MTFIIFKWVLVKVIRAQTHRVAQCVPVVDRRDLSLGWGLSGYYTECLTIDHSG